MSESDFSLYLIKFIYYIKNSLINSFKMLI